MPLSIARIDREEDLKALAQSLYVIERDDRTAIRRAMEALRRANPALADRTGFKPGLIIRVPRDIGLAVTDRVEKREETDVRGLLQEVAQRLEIGGAFARDAFAANTRASKDSLERLQDERFREAIKSEAPGSEELVAESMEAMKARTVENQSRQEQLSRAIEKAAGEIQRLRRLAGDD